MVVTSCVARARVESLLVDDDANDVRRFAGGKFRLGEFVHDRFAIGHLGHVLGRDEADRVDVAETERDQAREVFYFFFCGNDVGEALPGVAWAFDYR